MKVAERQKAITSYLLAAKEPGSGTELSQHFNISRQIIVQDIAILKGTGCDILSTSQGYIMQNPLSVKWRLKYGIRPRKLRMNCPAL